MAKTYSVKQVINKLQNGKKLAKSYKVKTGNIKNGGSYFAGSVGVSQATSLVNDWLEAINGATNKASLSPGQLSYKLVDTFSSISANKQLINPYTAGVGYSFTNVTGSLGAITSEQAIIVDGAINANQYTYTIAGTDPTYTLTSSAAAVNEGQAVTFTLATTNVEAGTELPWAITGIGQQFINGELSGVAIVGPNGQAVIPVSIAAVINGGAAFTFSIAGKSTSVTVNDPTPATYELTSSTDALTNGGTVVFTLGTSGVPAGSSFAYELTGIPASLIEGGATTGFATVGADGTALVSVTLVDTLPFTGTDVLTISFPGLPGAPSSSVDITNTATPVFTINKDDLSGNPSSTDFFAPLSPNPLGLTSNTLQSTDRATGAAGAGITNQLIATLIPEGDNLGGITATTPNTTNIQNVFITAKGGVAGGETIEAEGFIEPNFADVVVDAYDNSTWNMSDVQQWWSSRSDSNLLVTDATLLPGVAVGMDGTAEDVDYEVEFRSVTLSAEDNVTVVLNNVGRGQQGGILTIGSAEPLDGNLGRRGIETFNVLVGESSSFLEALQTTGNRLDTVNVEQAPLGLGAPGAPIGQASADTVVAIENAFEDLSTFDAEGFIGQIGSLTARRDELGDLIDDRVEFNYNTVHAAGSTLAGIVNPAINILGGDGGNTLGVYIGEDTGIDLVFNGGDAADDMEIDQHEGVNGGSRSITVNTDDGDNDLSVARQDTGALTATGGNDADDFDFNSILATSISVDLRDGSNVFEGDNLAVTGDFDLDAGVGSDDVEIDNLTAANVSVDVDNGIADISLIEVTATLGDIEITAGDGAKDFYGEDLQAAAGSFNLAFGVGEADIDLLDSSFRFGTTITIADDTPGTSNTIDLVDVGSAGIENRLTITTGATDDDVNIAASAFTNGSAINLGSGTNILTVSGTLLGSPAVLDEANTVTTGSGTDTVEFDGVIAFAPVTIDTDGGTDSVFLVGGAFNNAAPNAAPVTINTGSDADTVDVNGGTFGTLTINTDGSEDNGADTVVIDNVATNAAAINIRTGAGDDQATYRNTAAGLLNIDMGEGYDTFSTDENLGLGPIGDPTTPVLFSNIEKLVLLRDDALQTVNMAVLNSRSGPGGIVQDIWVQPEVGSGDTTITNVAADLGQNVTITNRSLPTLPPFVEWATFNGFVGDVNISTLIDDEADIRTLDVTLDASGSGGTDATRSVTAVRELEITDNSIGVASIERVVLNSTSLEGQANARNVVQFFDGYNDTDAEGLELLRITGDRSLALHIGGEDGSIGLQSSEGTVDVRADDLEGDLQLVLNGTDLSNSTAQAINPLQARADRLTANDDGDHNNLLALYGEDINVNTITETDFVDNDPADSSYINGFSTIQFGTDDTGVMSATTGLGLGYSLGVSGVFDAVGMTPGITYDIVNTIGTLTLDNLASTVEINLTLADDEITLNDREGDEDEVLNLDLYANDGVDNNWLNGTQVVNVNGFETVLLDVSAVASANLDFDLEIDADATDLTITSGAAEGVNALAISTGLPTTLRTIDVSNYEGSFTGSFIAADQKTIGAPDVFIVVGDNAFTFTLTEYDPLDGGDGISLANFNSTFVFTQDASAEWSITNFLADNLAGVDENNYSILDFSNFAEITDETKINVTVDGADLLITPQNSELAVDLNFQIRLVGLGADGPAVLGNTNYIFA